jgi:deoxyribonuclease-4
MAFSKTFLVGAHMSINGGLANAIKDGIALKCTTIQLFLKNNRQWGAKKLTQQEIDSFSSAAQKSLIQVFVAHATYLINLGSPNKEVCEKSITALIDELERCHLLQIPYLVLHPGSRVGSDETVCLDKIAANINTALAKTNSTSMILLELMAGQGGTVCYTFEQLAYLYKNINDKKRIGVCFDTCHAFAAGYDFNNPTSYEEMWQKFDQTIGIDLLKVIHMNDSKKNLGSRVDRHEHIGKGMIGLEAFRLICNDKRFFNIPKILETPKNSPEDDQKNLELLYSLLTDQTKMELGV